MQSGKTILLVSHDMVAVTRLCKRVLLLNKGLLIDDGPAFEVVSRYLSMLEHSSSSKSWVDSETAPGNAIVRLRHVRVLNEDGETADVLDIRRPIGIEATYDVLLPGHMLIPNYHFHNDQDMTIFAVQDTFSVWRNEPRPVGRFISTAWLPGNFLAEGRVNVGIYISSHQPESFVHVMARNVLTFQVVDPMEGDSVRGDYTGPYPGLVRPMANWETEIVQSSLVELDRSNTVR
jgi:lipopolysaccharide transport system ATP-binding protein